MRFVISKNIIILVIYFFHSFGFASVCKDWFQESKIKSSDKLCVSKCNTYPVDMSTFICHNECEIYCKNKKCNENSFWKNKIKIGRPKNWEMQWKNDRGVFYRQGPFLSSDAKESPEEDFAVNIEHFLFENEKIKKQLPKAYSWIDKNFSKNFNFNEVCND